MTSRADPMLGRTLGDFVIRERIGSGGVGEVFRAEQATLGREAVIKVLTRNRERGTQAADRFLREAKLASRLDHPYAAHIYAFGAEPDGMLWIAMELVRGIPLDRHIATQGPLPLARFIPLFERLSEVLNAAHEQGIVHRDVKPANVMVLSRTGRLLPKLLDLGIARSDNPVGLIDAAEINVDAIEGSVQPEDAHQTEAELLVSKSNDLTMAGMVIGTPHFMAPEQWSDASTVDRRSDVYSMGVLAYQALTGRLPFSGHSIRSMARAHAQQPLPPLGEGFPEAMYAVLQKATAKHAEDRFASALEFASALRVASGLEIEPDSLPQIDDHVRETVLARAPQPIAEAVAMFEAARTPRQAVDAVMAVQRVVTRHLALIALAARARIGAGGDKDAEAVESLLKRAASGRIDDDAWRTLAIELCRPFANRRDTYPVPESVMVFFTSDARPGTGALALERLACLTWPTIDAGQDELMAFLHQAVTVVTQVLSSVSFIFDYPLVVRRNDIERWMGTRRNRRSAQDVLGPQPAPGEVVLLNPAGAIVLSLTPLVQLIEPSGGAAQELFYLDGPGRYGARMVAFPGPFERQDPELWAWFSTHIIDVMASEIRSHRDEAEPYKGLSPFTARDADNYFGREKEAQGFANRLRAERLLAVVGPSGAGKSSFIYAGVVPLLPQGWRAVAMRPGTSPLAALAHRFTVEQLGVEGFADKVRADPLALANQVAGALPAGQTLVLVVDQFEELLTLCPDPEERQAFARALTASADMPGSRLRVVMTLRDDFLIQVTQLEAFRERLSSALQLLATPAIDDLIRVLTEPAKRSGYGFDDETLPKRMVDAVREHSGALALLSFSASQMWKLRDRHLRLMRAKTYEALGGVAGALANHAESTLAMLSPVEHQLVRETFRQLVTSQGTRAVMTRKELLEVLGNDLIAHRVVDAMVNARLLVSGSDVGQTDRIEIIHESLVQSWPRLVQWLREAAETVRLRDALRGSARHWEERGRPRGLLWRDETLAEYRLWKTRFIGGVTQSEQAFADASEREESRGRLFRTVAIATVFVALVVGLVVVSRAYRTADSALTQAEISAKEAQQRLASLRQEQGRLAMLDSKPMEALAYLDAARAAGASGQAIDHMLAAAAWLSRGEVRRFGANEPLVDERLSPDEKTLAIFHADGRVTLWDVASGTKRAVSEANGVNGAFASNGAFFVGTSDGKVEIIDAMTGRRRAPALDLGSAPIFRIDASADGTVLATSTVGDTAALIHHQPHRRVIEVRVPGVPALATLLRADGKRLAMFAGPFLPTTATLRQVRVIDTADARELARVVLPEPAREVAFGPDDTLAIAMQNGTVALFDIRARRLRWATSEHAGAVNKIELSPSGQQLLSLGADGRATLWDTRSGTKLHSLVLASGPLQHGFWASDEWVMVQAPDGSVQKINARTGERDWRFVGVMNTASLWRTNRGATMMTCEPNGIVRLWDTQTAGGQSIFANQEVKALFSSRGSDGTVALTRTGWLVTTSDDAVPMKAPQPVSPSLNEVAAAELSADHTSFARISHGRVEVLAKGDGAVFEVAETLESEKPFFWFAADLEHRRLAAQTMDGSIVLWVGTPFQASHTLEPENHQMRTPGFFTADGRLITGSASGELEAWDVATGERLNRVQAFRSFISPAPSMVADRFFTIGLNGSIGVWSLSEFSRVGDVPGVKAEPLAVALSDDGALLSEWMPDGTWVTWELSTRRILSRLKTLGGLATASVGAKGVGLVSNSGTAVRWPTQLTYSSGPAVPDAIACGSLKLRDESLEERDFGALLQCPFANQR